MLKRLLNVLIVAALQIAGTVGAADFAVLGTRSARLEGTIVGRYFSLVFAPVSAKAAGDGLYRISVYQDRQIPYYTGMSPVATTMLTCLASTCSRAVEAPITNAPYIVGIGAAAGEIATTVSFAPGNRTGAPFQSSVSVAWVGINSIVVAYTMPAGYRPPRSGAWLGLWAGTELAGVPPLATVSIDSDMAQDVQAINGLDMRNDATYTVGLSPGPGNNGISALAVFKTAAF